MLVECPGCKKMFRAYIEGKHQYIEYKDVHGDRHKEHADTCKCAKAPLVAGKENGAANKQ